MEQCTEELQKTKWYFKLITSVTIFPACLKNNPMGCRDSVLPKNITRNPSVLCLLSNKDKLPYEDHLCLNRARGKYMNGHKGPESLTSRNFTKT